MFSTEHILYIVFSILAVALVGFLCHFIKNQKWKDITLAVFAFSCFIVHISTIYVSFFEHHGGHGDALDYHLFPIYFCNFMMDLLLVAAVWPNKKSTFFKNFATFLAYGCIFGGLITTFTLEPGVASWGSFKSALSHTLMLMSGVYLMVGGYVKINVYNTAPYAIGLLICGAVGGIVEGIFSAAGLPSPNAMYMQHGPNEAPMFNAYLLAITMLAVMFVFGAIWEFFAKKKEDRWYKSIQDLKEYFPIKKKAKAVVALSTSATENENVVEKIEVKKEVIKNSEDETITVVEAEKEIIVKSPKSEDSDKNN